MKTQTLTPQELARARHAAVARALAALGGRATLARIARRLNRPLRRVLDILRGGSAASPNVLALGLPVTFVFDNTDDTWAISSYGEELAREAADPRVRIMPVPKAGVPKAGADSAARAGLVDVRCGACGRSRTLTRYGAASARGRGSRCRHCADAARDLPRVPAGDTTPQDPLAPTGARPGSEAKILILQARFALWSEGDLRGSIFLPGDVVLTATAEDDELGAA